jgi:plasmid stabilization system protein ParE
MNVVYAPRALRDLEGIAAYLVEPNPAGATRAKSFWIESIVAPAF